MSIDFFEIKLLTKLDLLQEQLEEVEQTMMTTMERSLKIVEASKESTRTELEELKNHMMPKLNHIQETTQNELKNIGESMKTLIQFTDSVRNISEQSKFITQLRNMMHPVSSCRQALKVSGKYMLKIEENVEPFEVFCEQNKFEGGWIVIQHRYDGSVNFYRNWTEYQNGFGALDGEFWLGLEYVHQITKNRPHELLVEIQDFHGNYGYAKYGQFELGSESEKYMLKKLGTYSGTAGDSIKWNEDEMFSTFDRDNDGDSTNCAEERHGAWWYFRCTSSNLNGRYQNVTNDESAIEWWHFKNDSRGMSYSRMMIREVTP
ncbi:fibrinogen-like protein A [Anopheles coustani]|uniref:fibrinogen-like protein A n=1 Tax=Anopheles coustani TaxID=139045 RepID=UPI002657F8CB|nr:fibrinogen-like protein A [Anopheles coustani]